MFCVRLTSKLRVTYKIALRSIVCLDAEDVVVSFLKENLNITMRNAEITI